MIRLSPFHCKGFCSQICSQINLHQIFIFKAGKSSLLLWPFRQARRAITQISTKRTGEPATRTRCPFGTRLPSTSARRKGRSRISVCVLYLSAAACPGERLSETQTLTLPTGEKIRPDPVGDKSVFFGIPHLSLYTSHFRSQLPPLAIPSLFCSFSLNETPPR